MTAGASPAPGANANVDTLPSSTRGAPDAKATAAMLQQELNRKNMSLAKAEEKCLVLEARQEDFAHLLQGFREEKVCVCSGLCLSWPEVVGTSVGDGGW